MRLVKHVKSKYGLEVYIEPGEAIAIRTGALVATAFLAVGREGLETALFVWASVRASGDGTQGPLIGVLLGIATAVVLGYLFYRGAVRIDLDEDAGALARLVSDFGETLVDEFARRGAARREISGQRGKSRMLSHCEQLACSNRMSRSE